jgi:antitoxin ParD1/3/4
VALPRRFFISASGGWGLGPQTPIIDFAAPKGQIPAMSDTPRSLAEPAREWIATRVASGAWPNADAYLSDLVERDREDAAKLTALHAALDEGEASGISELTIDEIFAAARQRNLRASA